MNDGVDCTYCSLQYITVDDAAKAITSNTRCSLLAKIHVEKAYRNVPVHPDDRWLLGMMWEGNLFVDTALLFGLRTAPKIFSAIADAVEWILRQNYIRVVMHYLDDFLLIGAPHSDECKHALSILLSVFAYLGLPVAEK